MDESKAVCINILRKMPEGVVLLSCPGKRSERARVYFVAVDNPARDFRRTVLAYT